MKRMVKEVIPKPKQQLKDMAQDLVQYRIHTTRSMEDNVLNIISHLIDMECTLMEAAFLIHFLMDEMLPVYGKEI